MLMPELFTRNVFDDWFDDFGLEKEMNDLNRKIYGRRASREMLTDVREHEDHYDLEIDLPGFKKEDVKMQLKEGVLNIEATTSTSNDEKDEDGNLSAMHHPFTQPKLDELDKLDTDILGLKANAYDIVLNGVELGGGSVRIQNVYWESTGVNKSKSSMLDVDTYEKHKDSNRELLRIENEAGTKNFIITPVGKSPMGLKQLMYKEQQNGQTVGVEQWVDYDDNVVVEYTYGNSEVQTAKMRVVRKAYHEEEVPSMVFSINPAIYTFATGAEVKEFDVVATHQHGTVIYNVDGQVIKENYTTKENISFKFTGETKPLFIVSEEEPNLIQVITPLRVVH